MINELKFAIICNKIEEIITEMCKDKSSRPKEWHYHFPNELKIALKKIIDEGLFENIKCNE